MWHLGENFQIVARLACQMPHPYSENVGLFNPSTTESNSFAARKIGPCLHWKSDRATKAFVQIHFVRLCWFEKKIMKLKLLILTTLLTVALVGVVPVLSTNAEVKNNTAQNSVKGNSRLQTYVKPDRYSIRYPVGWTVDEGETVIMSNYRVPQKGSIPASQRRLTIKTDISLQPGSLETVYQQLMTSPTADRSQVIKEGKALVGGRDAIRMWISVRGFDYPNAITTLIRYSDKETAAIVSYYDYRNPNAVNQIQTVHGSFRAIN